MFCIVFGCKNLGLKNPACVKKMTNMRYGDSLIFFCCFFLLIKVHPAKVYPKTEEPGGESKGVEK